MRPWALLCLLVLSADAAEPRRVELPGAALLRGGPAVALPWRPVDVSRDGREVNARFHADPGASERALAAPLLRVRSAVAEAGPVLEESVSASGWALPPGTPGRPTLSDPCCGDAAPKLTMILQRLGLPVDSVEAQFHVFGLWRHDDGDIFVDPTIRQFFGRRRAPASVPAIFVGTRGQLDALFQAHAYHRIKSYYEPATIYFREAVTRNERVLELERALRQRADLQVLARWLRSRLRR